MLHDKSIDRTAPAPVGAGVPDLPIAELRGRWVIDSTDGMGIGEVDDMFVDHTTGELRYLKVEAGGILGIGKSFGLVPIQAIVGFDGDRLLAATERLVGSMAYLDGRQPRWDIPRRTTVRCADGAELGNVTQVHPGFVVAEHGIYFPHDYYVPNDAITIYDGHRVWLRVSKSEALDQGWNVAPPLLVRADQFL